MTDENQHPYVYTVVIKYFGPQQCHVYQEATFHIYTYDLSLLYCIIADKANIMYLWNPHYCIIELGNDYNYKQKHRYQASTHIKTIISEALIRVSSINMARSVFQHMYKSMDMMDNF